MSSAPNVYMFVYTLIGAQIVPLSDCLSLETTFFWSLEQSLKDRFDSLYVFFQSPWRYVGH